MVKTYKTSLPHIIPDKDIARGKIYRAAFPYLEERPLSFLEELYIMNSVNIKGAGKNTAAK